MIEVIDMTRISTATATATATATRSCPPIEVIDISYLQYVVGGVDKQTQAAQLVITQAVNAVKQVADSLAPKNTGLTDVLMQVMSQRRSNSGPSSAPALPPTSTLTR
jgi:hypothetical protein